MLDTQQLHFFHYTVSLQTLFFSLVKVLFWSFLRSSEMYIYYFMESCRKMQFCIYYAS